MRRKHGGEEGLREGWEGAGGAASRGLGKGWGGGGGGGARGEAGERDEA